MASPKEDSTRPHFLNGVVRVRAGLELQRSRILGWAESAPQLLPGVVDLRDTPSHDLDYYVYELGRLQDIAREVLSIFSEPAVIKDALAAFEMQIPNLRRIRNPLTHIDGRPRLDGVMWFDSIVATAPDGAVEYLVDPRYRHHDAALTLAAALEEFLQPPRGASKGTDSA